MSKKKKKPVRLNKKITTAQQRNEFIKRIKFFCDNIADSQIFSLIPQNEIENIYNQRFRSTKIIPAPHQKISRQSLKDFKFFISRIFNTKNITLGLGTQPEISYQDYFTYILTLMLFAGRINDTAFPNAHKVKKALAPLSVLAENDFYEKAWQDYHKVINSSSILNSSIKEGLYVANFNFKYTVNDDIGFFPFVEIHHMQVEKILVLIDGETRPAYKLGWFFPGDVPHFLPITIKSEFLNLQAGFSLDIYIQAHALNRLAERMDRIVSGYLHYGIFISFQDVKVCKNKKGDLLFEYYAFGVKTGYFKGDVVDGKLILRTFLFLTNNDTPEGEMLQDNTGIMKEDKIYLTIDRLSTFLTSDIGSNERVKNIFIKAGCESIFKIDRSIYFSQEGIKERFIADQIATYLKLDNNIPTIGNNEQ